MLMIGNKMLNQSFMLPIPSICNKMPTQFHVAYSKHLRPILYVVINDSNGNEN